MASLHSKVRKSMSFRKQEDFKFDLAKFSGRSFIRRDIRLNKEVRIEINVVVVFLTLDNEKIK
jgi:hypothetical protein